MLSISVVIALAAVLFCILYQYNRWRKSKTYRLPPGPKGNAILGNMVELVQSFMKGEAPFLKFAQWASEHGSICYLRFFRQRVLIISDAQVAQQLCVGQSDKFSCRPSGLFLARVLKGKGIVMNDGPSWKEHRSFVSAGFRKYGLGNSTIEQRIQFVVDEFLQQIDKVVDTPHDPHLDLAVATYNIIWTAISGDKFKWDDPFLNKLIVNLETNLEAVELVGAHNYILIWSLFHLLWHNMFRLFYIVLERFVYFRKLIVKNRKDRDNVDESMIQDYLNKIQIAKKNNEQTCFSEWQLLWLVSDLFIAGGETTITNLRWAILCLANFPEIQKRCRQELIDNVGLDSPPMCSQRPSLPYLEAFIHEVLRLGAVPGMWRTTSEDAKFENYDIPKDTWVLLHFWAMSNNPNHWEDERAFRPERFLNEDGTFRKNDHLLAFSTGKRQCPGETLARTEMFLFLANILQKYHLKLAEPVDVQAGTFGVTYVPPHFKVIFTRV